MRFDYVQAPQWPPLAWLARCHAGSSTIAVFHGPRVETTDDWFAEAVWAGDYEGGGFDQTDIVAGSGARLRDDTVVFVSSGSTVDRLHSLQAGGDTWISNSLSCLLATVKGSLEPTYPRYQQDMRTIVYGLSSYQRVLKTSAGAVHLTYFENLRWDGRSLTLEAKPAGHRDFTTFARYRGFLESSMQLLAENMATKRRYPYTMLSTISSGYDSPTVTVLARQAGCVETLSLDRARDGDEDSGAAIANMFGLRSRVVQRDAWRSMTLPEIPFMVGSPHGAEVVLKSAEDYLAGRVLFTGFHGDKMWAKDTQDLSENIVRGDNSGSALSEYRLWVGFIHCPVAFWGVRRIRDVHAISNSPEMKPWDVTAQYSRPIPRRIVEEAGVPRELFGTRKRAADVALLSHQSSLTAQSFEDYMDWLREHRWEWVRHARIPPLWGSSTARMYTWVVRHAKWNIRGTHRLRRLNPRRYMFPWAVERAKQRYPRPF
jgi:hypothetical protein